MPYRPPLLIIPIKPPPSQNLNKPQPILLKSRLFGTFLPCFGSKLQYNATLKVPNFNKPPAVYMRGYGKYNCILRTHICYLCYFFIFLKFCIVLLQSNHNIKGLTRKKSLSFTQFLHTTNHMCIVVPFRFIK